MISVYCLPDKTGQAKYTNAEHCVFKYGGAMVSTGGVNVGKRAAALRNRFKIRKT